MPVSLQGTLAKSCTFNFTASVKYKSKNKLWCKAVTFFQLFNTFCFKMILFLSFWLSIVHKVLEFWGENNRSAVMLTRAKRKSRGGQASAVHKYKNRRIGCYIWEKRCVLKHNKEEKPSNTTSKKKLRSEQVLHEQFYNLQTLLVCFFKMFKLPLFLSIWNFFIWFLEWS